MVSGDGFVGTQAYIPPKFSFSSDFGHFILKMFENVKNSCVKKKILKYYNFWGMSLADFSTAGDASPPPVPPLSTPMRRPGACYKYELLIMRTKNTWLSTKYA